MSKKIRNHCIIIGAILGAMVGLFLWRRSRTPALAKCDRAFFTVSPGTLIQDAAAEACELADEGDYRVSFDFNDVRINVDPGMDVRAVVNCYQIGLAHLAELDAARRAAVAEKNRVPAEPVAVHAVSPAAAASAERSPAPVVTPHA
jgi:hypothetical protein